MGKGAAAPPPPTAEELQRQALANQLLQQQVLQAQRDQAEYERTHSAEYLAAQKFDAEQAALKAKSGTFNSNLKSQYDNTTNAIRAQLKELGQEGRYGELVGKIGQDYQGALDQFATNNDYDPTNVFAGKDYAADIVNPIRTQRRDQAYNEALTSNTAKLHAAGLDDLVSKLTGKIDTTKNLAGLSANDYTPVFANDYAGDIMNEERTNRRTNFTTQLNTLLGGTDAGVKAFDDTMDDPFISSIIGTDYGNADAAIKRAAARGSLTDVGFQAAQDTLNNNKKAADATAQTLGGTVLSKNRDALGNVVNSAYTKAGGYDFGQQFDPNAVLTEFNTKKADLTNNLEGDIRSTLQGQKWFDLGDIFSKAGIAQGAQNTKQLDEGFNPLAALTNATNSQKDTASRGLGGTGTF